MTHCGFVNKDICGNSAQVGRASVALAVALICGCKDRWINSNTTASSGGVVCNCASVEVKSQGEETEAERFVIEKTGCVRSWAIWWLYLMLLSPSRSERQRKRRSLMGVNVTRLPCMSTLLSYIFVPTCRILCTYCSVYVVCLQWI